MPHRDERKPRALTALAGWLKRRFGSRRAIALLIAFTAIEVGGLLLAWSALAGSAYGVRNTACVGGRFSVACSTNWRYQDDFDAPVRRIAPDPREEAAALERDRKWLARCRPQLRADQYGVSRYVYAAAGCEHGRLE
jgi:hypothetical protein